MLSERDKKYLLKLKEKIVFKCPKCRGKDPGCECLDLFRLEFKKVKANIPIKYRNASLETITHPETVDVRTKVRNYITNLDSYVEKGVGLFLYGSTGLAKTFIACCILIEALKQKRSVYFITLDQCVTMLTASWRKDETKVQFQELILGTDLLVLDEVGNESRLNITLVRGCINDILRQRGNNLQPTIVTSNLLFDKLKEVYGEEVHSIINELCVPLEFKGADFRQNVIGDIIS